MEGTEPGPHDQRWPQAPFTFHSLQHGSDHLALLQVKTTTAASTHPLINYPC